MPKHRPASAIAQLQSGDRKQNATNNGRGSPSDFLSSVSTSPTAPAEKHQGRGASNAAGAVWSCRPCWLESSNVHVSSSTIVPASTPSSPISPSSRQDRGTTTIIRRRCHAQAQIILPLPSRALRGQTLDHEETNDNRKHKSTLADNDDDSKIKNKLLKKATAPTKLFYFYL